MIKHMKIQKFNQIDYYSWLVRQVVDKQMDLSDVMEILQEYYQVWFNNYYKQLSIVRERKKQLDNQIVNMQNRLALNIKSVNNCKQILDIVDEKIKHYNTLLEIEKIIINSYMGLEEKYEEKLSKAYMKNNTKKIKNADKRLHELRKRQYFVLDPDWIGSRIVPVYEDTPQANSGFKGRYYEKYLEDGGAILSKYGMRMDAAKRTNSILTYKYVISKIRTNLETQVVNLQEKQLLNDKIPKLEQDIKSTEIKLNKLKPKSEQLIIFDMLWNNIMN